MPQRDWQAVVENLTQVQQLMHLVMRQQPEDALDVQNQIFAQKRHAYEDELTAQAASAGCPGRKGVVSPPTLARMMEEARTESLGIINTYNYDMAIAIRNIGTETPTANRYVYAKRLAEWEALRAEWKSKQIMLWDTTRWIDAATKDFLANNAFLQEGGYAIVEPQSTAICDVCRYWVRQGKMKISRTTEVEFPIHVNCPHHFVVHYRKRKLDCSQLWVGVTLEGYWEEIGG